MAGPARMPGALRPGLLPASHVTHNKCYATFARFRTAMLAFLTQEVPKNWPNFRESVTDNFRVIDPKDIRVLT